MVYRNTEEGGVSMRGTKYFREYRGEYVLGHPGRFVCSGEVTINT
jgi:hypothetical protein